MDFSDSDEEPPSAFNVIHRKMMQFLTEQKKMASEEYLYLHQLDAVFAAKKQLEDPSAHNVALVVLPTGCGKTGVAVLSAYALNALRVLVITPSVKVSEQIYNEFCSSEMRCFLARRRMIKNREQEQKVLPIGHLVKRSCEIKPKLRCHVMVLNAHKVGGKSSVAIEDIPKDSYDVVIVDEAHHYPAPTWKLLVDHFSRNTKRIFLTATPLHEGKLISKVIFPRDPSYRPCFWWTKQKAVEAQIIRPLQFDEIKWDDTLIKTEMGVYKVIAQRIERYLDMHDLQDQSVRHQAMVLTQTKEMQNAAKDFRQAYYEVTSNPEKCAVYISGTKEDILKKYVRGEIRTLVVIGRLLEGFDHNSVSVVAIVRNVASKSRVLFAQFVGRAVRKVRKEDPVEAVLVSHEYYDQGPNYRQFEDNNAEIAQDDPDDADD